MAERRKIIIETGAEPEEPLPTPHFDTEATLTARPVVPLSDQEPYQPHYNDYGGHVGKPFWKRPALLVLVVLVAVGVGIAAGIAIGFYRSRGAEQTPVAAAPSPTTESSTPTSTKESADSGQVVETPEPESTSQARVAVPEKPEEPIVEPKDEERERTARNERRDSDRKDDDEVKPPVVREKKPVKVDEYIIEDGREAEKERRREERRAERREKRRRQRDEESNFPRQVERTGRELDRIRDIFEGRQP